MEAAQQFPGDGHDMSMAAATDDALVIESPKGTPWRRRTANVSRRSLPDGGGEPANEHSMTCVFWTSWKSSVAVTNG